jgi:hypothetical protein
MFRDPEYMICDLLTPLGGKRVGSMGRVLAKAIISLEKEAFLFVLTNRPPRRNAAGTSGLSERSRLQTSNLLTASS